MFVEYQMPEMSGATFIRSLKQTHPNLPCIMLSGQANSSQIEALEDDMLLEAFLHKPWEEIQISQIINNINND